MKATAEVSVFDVLQGDADEWLVVAIDGMVLGPYGKKPDAVNVARALALCSRPSRLVVRASDGEIESVTPFEVEGCS